MRLFDESRFNEIYDRYSAGLIRYCLVRLGNDRAAAEEAATDAFMTLFRKWDEIDVDSNIGAWLIKSADYCVKHQWEKYGRYYGKIEPLDDTHETIAAPDSPENEVVARDTLERVAGKIPEKYAELFRLRNIEGLSMADAAKRLGENYTTTRFRYKRLDEILEKPGEKIRRDEF